MVSQCDNLLLMRMNSMADVADLSRLFSFVPEGLMAGAPSFGLGQALVTGRIFPQGGAYVRMGDRVSEEGGADIRDHLGTAARRVSIPRVPLAPNAPPRPLARRTRGHDDDPRDPGGRSPSSTT